MEKEGKLFENQVKDSYPYIVRSAFNNGIKGYVVENKDFLNPANTITFAQDTFIAFYQKESFFTGNNVKILKPISKNLSTNQSLFITTCLNKTLANLSWGIGSGTHFIKNITFSLPTLANGNLALDYMESYMQELERCKLEKLETYLKTSGLKDCNLTQQEKETLKRFSLTTQQDSDSMWREFKIKDLFRIKSNPQLNKDSFHFTPNGTYPYFTRTCQNNGINGYVDYLDEKHKIDGNSLAVGMLGMRFFYMKKDFYAGQFTKTIYAKFDGFNEKNALYFATSLNKAQAVFQGVLVRDFQKTLENYKIILPINSAGNPDLGFMQDFINALSKLAIKDITLWCERKLSTNKTYKTK